MWWNYQGQWWPPGSQDHFIISHVCINFPVRRPGDKLTVQCMLPGDWGQWLAVGLTSRNSRKDVEDKLSSRHHQEE